MLGFWGAVVNGGQINPQDAMVTLGGGSFQDLTFGPGLVEVNRTSATTNFINTATLSSGTS